jgi:hypothetical protein
MTEEELEDIRREHVNEVYERDLLVHDHRGMLLDEVDRLRAENARLVAAGRRLLTEAPIDVQTWLTECGLRAAIEGTECGDD